jgi:signal transduction histidine kinase
MVIARPFATATWHDTGYLLLGAATAWIAFSVLLLTVIGGGLLALTILGLPVLLLCFWLVRGTAGLDRRRAALVLGEPIEARYRQPPDTSITRRLWTVVKDPQSWKDVVWLAVGSVLGFAHGIVAGVIWAAGITQLTTLVWWWIPAKHDRSDGPGLFDVDTWELALLASVSGLAICLAAPWVVRVLAFIDLWIARKLLGPGKSAKLEERVTELAETRAGALSGQSAELQRIERDLHDGAQARLVALAMDLGLAREKLEQDPVGARVLVDSAHQEAKIALKELRELVRGVHPSILTDRGLDPALSALAARSPVPVALSVELRARLDPTVEAAAYFVVNEALANVAKHSRATSCRVEVARTNGELRIVVADDGDGGADPGSGSGLAGLQRRVRALDGRLSLESPSGGGTVLRVEIPCEL